MTLSKKNLKFFKNKNKNKIQFLLEYRIYIDY